MQEFFQAQTLPNRKALVDIELFIKAQASLASALGEESTGLDATTAFLDVNSMKVEDVMKPLQSFVKWQAQQLVLRKDGDKDLADIVRGVTKKLQHERMLRSPERFKVPHLQQGFEVLPHAGVHALESAKPRLDKLEPIAACDTPSHPRSKDKQKKFDVLTEALASTATEECAPSQSKQKISLDGSWPGTDAEGPQRNKDVAAKPKKTTAFETNQNSIRAARHREALANASAIGASKLEAPRAKNIRSGGLSRGAILYKDQRFVDLATHGRDVPETHATSIETLVDYLVKDTKSDEEKAFVIFSWVCYHVKYDIDGLYGRRPRQDCKAESVLKSRLSVCAGYAGIFEMMAKQAGLSVQQVVGTARTLSDGIGQDVKKTGHKGAHAWNAVQLGGKWFLVDCCWGAGTCTAQEFTPNFRPHFFGPVPRQLAFSHFPEDPSWQLMPSQLTYQQWIDQPILSTEAFFSHEIEFFAPMQPGLIDLSVGTNEPFVLRAPDDVYFLANFGAQKLDIKRDPVIAADGKRSSTMCLPQAKGRKWDLEIFARRGGPYGSFTHACKLAVQQS